jgi:tetratricopeptide (TPR) repeat protein
MRILLIWMTVLGMWFGLCSCAQAQVEQQNAKPDSLLILLQLAITDTARAGLLLSIGSWYNSNGDFPNSYLYYSRSLKLYTLLNDSLQRATVLNNLGQLHYREGQFPEALRAHSNALLLFEQLGNRKGMGLALLRMGNVYYEQFHLGGNILDSARLYYNLSLDIRIELGDAKGVAGCHIGLGNVLSQQDSVQTALQHYAQALEYYNNIGDIEGQAKCVNNMGHTLYHDSQYAEALKYYMRALELHEQFGDKRGLTYPLDNIAEIYLLRLGRPLVARQYARRALALAQEVQAFDRMFTTAHTNAMIDSALGDWRSAYTHAELSAYYSNEVFNAEKATELGRIEARFQIERKLEIERRTEELRVTQQLLETERSNTLQYVGVAVGIVVLFIVALVAGRIRWLARISGALVFIASMLVFEFGFLILDRWMDANASAPTIRLLFNALLALAIAPVHLRLARFVRQRLNTKLNSAAENAALS